jgi:hypothetical protein
LASGRRQTPFVSLSLRGMNGASIVAAGAHTHRFQRALESFLLPVTNRKDTASRGFREPPKI